MPALRVLELFSGIGGMHFGLCRAGLDFEVVAAVDINDVANRVYAHNFPATRHDQSNICGLSAADVNRLQPDLIAMSPPCQPFTRQGLKRDVADARTQPLTHLIALIPKLDTVKYFFVENVKGFEDSEARTQLVASLTESGFDCQEFLLSPTHLGVPNSRLRYYLLAKKKSLPAFSFATHSSLHSDLSPFGEESLEVQPRTLADYLEEDESAKDFLLADQTLSKYAEVLDIVRAESDHSCCFTKAYGKYAQGTGSVLQQGGCVDAAYATARSCSSPAEAALALRSLQLRYFTPREVSRLMGFPETFRFPQDTTTMQKFRVLGNSVNVIVVAFLLKHLVQARAI